MLWVKIPMLVAIPRIENMELQISNPTSCLSSIDIHIHNLSNICRICSNSLLTGNKCTYLVKDFLEQLLITFLVDCSSDKKEHHPANFCSRCHAAAWHKIKTGSATMLPHITWSPHNENNCHLCMKTKGGRPKKLKRKGRPKSVLNVEDIMSLDESTLIPPSIEKAVSHVISIKMKQSLLPNKSIEIVTGGSQNMTLTPITIARKESHSITSRTLRARTKQTTDIMDDSW